MIGGEKSEGRTEGNYVGGREGGKERRRERKREKGSYSFLVMCTHVMVIRLITEAIIYTQ